MVHKYFCTAQMNGISKQSVYHINKKHNFNPVVCLLQIYPLLH